jgi:Na+/melibiose symporter-like transporter
MLYQAEPGVGQAYLVGWLLVMYLGMSFLLLACNSWAATLATNYQERSRIFGIMAAVGVAGAISCLVVPVVVARQGGADADGIRAVGWFLTIAVPITIGLTVLATPEKATRKAEGHHFRLSDYGALLVRPNILRLLAADLCVTLGPGWMAALYLFFFEDSRGFNVSQANVLLLIYIAAGLLGAPATAWLANKISKHRALIVATTGYSLTLVLIFVIPKGNFAAMAPGMFVAGALAAGFVVMIRSLTADINDELRLEKGKDQIGLLYALTSATTKLAGALAITFTFNVLAAVGYNAKAGAHNTADAIRGLELAYIIGPIVFVMLGGACFLGYKLTAARHADIRRQLAERDGVYGEAPIVQAVTSEPGEILSAS